MARHPQIERLLSETLRILRVRSYSARTRETYARWIELFLTVNRDRPPDQLTRADVERFISGLTDAKQLAPKSRNQASSALAFFFREVLGRDELRAMPRAKEPKRVPSVLSHRQTTLVLGALPGKYRLLCSLMYGAGLRLTEAHKLRIKDIDFDLLQITVRDGKGAKDRWVMLPERLIPHLRRQIETVTRMHRDERRRGFGWAARLTPSHERIPPPDMSWAGSSCFPRAVDLRTPQPKGSAATISTPPRHSER